MAGKSDFFENALLLLIFNNTNIAGIGDATGVRGSTTVGSLYVSLHTADPTDAGAQSANEAAYTGYARQAAARSSAVWAVTGNSVSPVADIVFPASTGGSTTALTHWGVGIAASGATNLLYAGALSPSVAMAVGVAPRVTTASTITED